MVGKKLFALAIMGTAALAFPLAAAAQDTADGWAPYQYDSIVNPPENTGVSAWEPFKAMNGAPSVDQHLHDRVLEGAIDIHAHFGPDSYKRQWDAIEIAQRAQAAGLRGIVIKDHYSQTASLAKLIEDHITPGLAVWGGIALDSTVGGVNPMAVLYLAEVQGGRGQVVWMPTHDSEHEVKVSNAQRPYVRVSVDGQLIQQVYEVLDIIAAHDMTLATGHVTSEEMIDIVTAAHARGIDKIIITHPGLGPMFTDPSIDQLKQVAGMGAMVEVVATELFRDNVRSEVVPMMREVGPEHLIISTDSGLVGTPNHVDALVMAARILREEGFTEDELDLMYKTNPAKVLGLDS